MYNYRVYACTTIGYDVVQFLRIATRLSRSAEPSDKAEEAILSYPESYAFLLEKRFLVIWSHMPLHLLCYNFVVIAKVRLFREQTSRSLLLPTEHPKHKGCRIIPWRNHCKMYGFLGEKCALNVRNVSFLSTFRTFKAYFLVYILFNHKSMNLS